MVGAVVETFCQDDVWRNRVGRTAEPLPGEYRTREAAVEVARSEARIRGVAHVIRGADGTVEERNRYARGSDEIPG
ncbi:MULTISPECIES: DUF2188 domain-containing protein [unclassified Nocardioides]|uniref:DUF2188 domain-containing protein n=1 Tax=unclassified Nocardioides TaxID=2615069 RepID=UPI0009F0C894|nr:MULTISPECIES: DUF2188 domain-containing protein [unclassified Nocardioides]GAW50162.1 uncharacterized protein PD653B2_2493 [Nocardioides sp. PD653-B2]GAW54847.1 uncharacterized protein PD653_2261 [Nocardioides sp. PD653]